MSQTKQPLYDLTGASHSEVTNSLIPMVIEDLQPWRAGLRHLLPTA